MTAPAVRARFTARDLTEWAAFEKTYGPLTIQERVDAVGATIAAAVLVAGGARDVDPLDLIPEWDVGAREAQTEEEMMAKMRALMAPREEPSDDDSA